MEQETSASWLARWLKSEMFWQSIAVQTLGTLGAALIVALLTIFTGIGYTPAVRYFVIYGLIILVTVPLLPVGIPSAVIRLLRRMQSTRNLYVESVFETTTDRRPLFRWYTYSCDRRRLDSDYNWARYRPLHRKSD